MDDRRIILLATIVGAALGGTVAYLALTDRGRQTRDQLENWLEQAMREIGHLSRLARQVERIVSDGAQEWQRWREPIEQQARGSNLTQ